MADRNDPERLEQEARQMIEELTNQQPEPVAADTEEVEEEVFEEAPSEPEDEVEETVEAEAPIEEEEVSGESSQIDELLSKVDKAERAMKGAQAKMTKSNQEAAELRKANATLIDSIEGLKSQLLEKSQDQQKLNQLKEDYPDFAPLFDQNEYLKAELDRTNESLDSVRGDKQQLLEQQQREAHFAKIEAVHPDVTEITQTSDWALWLDAQDADIRHYIEAGSANDVNFALSKFKEDLKIKAPTPRETALAKAEEAAQPKMPKARRQKVGGKKTFSVEDITKMPLHEFEKNKDQILAAWGEGAIRR